MTLPLFDRTLSLKIGKPGAADALDVRDLRVVFSCKKTSTPDANTCTVTVYNLNETQRAKIQELSMVFSLEAGYSEQGGLQQIFIGDIVKLSHKYEAPDWLSVIQFNDGQTALNDSKAAVSFKAGAPVRGVMATIMKTMGVPSEIINPEEIINKQFANGYADEGPSRQLMNNIAGKLGVEWSIQNGKLIVRKYGGVDNIVGYDLSPDSGLIGSPVRAETQQTTEAPADSRPRWELKTLLLPGINPGNRLKVSKVKAFKDGIFKVDEVIHAGDTHGPEWNSSIVVVAL